MGPTKTLPDFDKPPVPSAYKWELNHQPISEKALQVSFPTGKGVKGVTGIQLQSFHVGASHNTVSRIREVITWKSL